MHLKTCYSYPLDFKIIYFVQTDLLLNLIDRLSLLSTLGLFALSYCAEVSQESPDSLARILEGREYGVKSVDCFCSMEMLDSSFLMGN